jgi:hypothetical protein
MLWVAFLTKISRIFFHWIQVVYAIAAEGRWFEEESEPQTPGNLRLDLYVEIECAHSVDGAVVDSSPLGWVAVRIIQGRVFKTPTLDQS